MATAHRVRLDEAEPGVDGVDEATALALYFCVAEAVQNARKHAGAGATVSVAVRLGAGLPRRAQALTTCGSRWTTTAPASTRPRSTVARPGPGWCTCGTGWRRWAASCRSGRRPAGAPR
ncbi:MAG: hypothetical protein R2755_17090 [Acidimicrobiales bacterium]